jgi:hypothetical protein
MLLPTISSYPSALTIGCTVTPSKCLAPVFSATEASMLA